MAVIDGKKQCSKCKKWKNVCEFYKSKKGDGYQYRCVICAKICNEKGLDKIAPNRKRRKYRTKLDKNGNDKNIIYVNNGDKCLVDEEDYKLVNKYRWVYDTSGYLINTNNTKMHRLIMNAKKGDIIDHINGDKIDNRKSNLRFCTNAQNTRHLTKLRKNNKSGKTGVNFHNRDKKWVAFIRVNNKVLHLGYFDLFEDAVEARIKAEIKYYGEYRPII